MTNQDKFIEIFGRKAWADMMLLCAFSAIPSEFRDFWAREYEKKEGESE